MISLLWDGGYDVIIADFAGGADFIQRNAFAFIELVRSLRQDQGVEAIEAADWSKHGWANYSLCTHVLGEKFGFSIRKSQFENIYICRFSMVWCKCISRYSSFCRFLQKQRGNPFSNSFKCKCPGSSTASSSSHF